MKRAQHSKAANGSSVKITAANSSKAGTQRIGFMKGKIQVPEDFDTMGTNEILPLMSGKVDRSPR